MAIDFGTARPSSLRFPGPVELEALAVPANDRFGLNNNECMSPVRAEAREPNPEDTVSRLELRTGFPLFEDGQLLTVSIVTLKRAA